MHRRVSCLAIAAAMTLSGQTTFAADAATTPTTAPSVAFQSDAFGNNFAEEYGELRLRIGDGVRVRGGHIRVTDELGNAVNRIDVPAAATSVAVPLKGRGYYRVEADVTTDGPKPITARTTASVVGPLLADDVRMRSPFGFFSVMGNSPLPTVAGMKWDRLFVPIHAIRQDSAGSPAWWTPQPPEPKYPRTVNGRPADRRWVGVFMHTPAWTLTGPNRAKLSNFNVYPPTDWDAFAKVVTFTSKHYSKFVDYFEPVNEPDANWRGTEEELVRYHHVVADAVHAANPDAKVAGPCLSSIDIPRLRTLAALGLFDKMDAVAIHAYSNDAPPEGKWLSSIYELKALLRSIGKEKLPVIVSEYGWQTVNGDWARPVDPLSQARYAARSLTLLVAEQVKAINYFCLRYEDQRIPHVQGWSVVEQDNTPRPSFAAIANVARWLADVDGPGTVLHPVPDSYLVLFRKKQGSVAVVWTTRGESTWTIPGGYKRVTDMTGRPVSPGADGGVRVSESPTFIELEDDALPAVTRRPAVNVIRGETVTLGGDFAKATVAAPLTLKDGRLSVAESAAAGEYLVLNRGSAGQWTAAPVRVLPRFAIESATTVWPDGAADPVVRLSIRSHGQAVSVLPAVKLAGAAPRFGARVTVPADATATVDIALDGLPLDRRWAGQAFAEARTDGRVESTEAPVAVALLTGGRVRQGESRVDWATVPRVDSRGWHAFGAGTDVAPLTGDDCSAELKWAWSDVGLHVRVDVRDNEHVQTREPQQMWQQDALQFAFDVDASKPWQMNLNNDITGLNGHRVFEYGVALRDGKPVTARWRDEIVKLPDDAAPVKADVVREGDRTRYEVMFPWSALGLKQPPAAGTAIGFDLVINDVDTPPNRRRGLEVFGGIHASKDPERYGQLLLRK